MDSFSLIVTIFAYVFVVVAYYVKVQKYFKMPLNLRWELYPIPHEKNYKYGGSYFEEIEWWNRPRHKNTLRSVLTLIKKYLFMGSYFEKKRWYWVGLYPWHMGFLLIVLFDGLVLFDAIFIKAGDWVISGSAGGGGEFLYYFTLVVGLTSFTIGCMGSILMLLFRTFNRELKEYATPQNYLNYIFFLAMFGSGWVAWAIDDNTFTGFREFWVGVLSLDTVSVGSWEYIHIVIFAAFLIYLPLTRSTHYITKILYFLWIQWGDTPNTGKGETDPKLQEYLNYEPKWSAAHHQTGKTWGERATRLPEKEASKKDTGKSK
ncbi:MAG: hypothetical protein FJZ95_03330 [Chloroflexi bacterium]|nr:hypothetical protein [Chloroflexota bacterium]